MQRLDARRDLLTLTTNGSEGTSYRPLSIRGAFFVCKRGGLWHTMKKRRTKTSDARVLGVKVAISNAGSLRITPINFFMAPAKDPSCLSQEQHALEPRYFVE